MPLDPMAAMCWRNLTFGRDELLAITVRLTKSGSGDFLAAIAMPRYIYIYIYAPVLAYVQPRARADKV